MTLAPKESSPEASRPEESSDDPMMGVASQSVSFRWHGPPPQMLTEYERIVPGAAEETLREWKNGLAHQRAEELAIMEAMWTNRRWAPAFRLLTLIVIIAAGLLAILLDEPAMGWFLGLGAALSYPISSALFRILRRRDNEQNSDQSNDS